MQELAPHAALVHAQTYYGGGEWYTLDIDHQQVADILRGAHYQAYISLQMEGKEDADTAVPKSLKMLRQCFSE